MAEESEFDETAELQKELEGIHSELSGVQAVNAQREADIKAMEAKIGVQKPLLFERYADLQASTMRHKMVEADNKNLLRFAKQSNWQGALSDSTVDNKEALNALLLDATNEAWRLEPPRKLASTSSGLQEEAGLEAQGVAADPAAVSNEAVFRLRNIQGDMVWRIGTYVGDGETGGIEGDPLAEFRVQTDMPEEDALAQGFIKYSATVGEDVLSGYDVLTPELVLDAGLGVTGHLVQVDGSETLLVHAEFNTAALTERYFDGEEGPAADGSLNMVGFEGFPY